MTTQLNTLGLLKKDTSLPYVVLAEYRPKENDCALIGKELTAITKELGLVPFKNKEIKRNKKAAWKDYGLHAEVRKTAVAGSEACGWHSDGDTTVSRDEMNFAMVVWANHDATEFQYKGKTYQPEPYELVIARNLGCHHRRPPHVNGHRLFFRQRVVVPAHIKLM